MPNIIPKHPGGRPTKYSDDILIKAQKYLEHHRQTKYTIPYIEELVLDLRINDDTLVAWTNARYPDDHPLAGTLVHEEFSATIKDIKRLQRLRLLKETIKPYPAGAIFQLKANHGMVETEKRILAGDSNADPIQIVVTEEERTTLIAE